MKSRCLLLEDYDSSAVDRDAEIISLMPNVSYELTRRRIPYRILEEFYDEKKLREGEVEYFTDQLRWFDDFDAFLKDHIRYCRTYQVPLARTYYNRLKYLVDSLVIQSYILRHAVDKLVEEGGEEIIYVQARKETKGPIEIDDFQDHEKVIFFHKLLPLICRRRNVSLSFSEIKAEENQKKEEGEARISLKSFIKKSPAGPFVRHARRMTKYKSWRSWFGRKRAEGLKILFLHTGSLHLDPIVNEFIQQAAEVYTLNDGVISRLNDLIPKIYLRVTGNSNENEAQEIQGDCEAAARGVARDGKPLLEWINKKCGLDVTALVAPYLEFFIRTLGTKVLLRTLDFRRFFSEVPIQFLITHTNSDANAKSAILAARIHGFIKTVCIQHCCDVYFDRIMHLTDIDPFDYYFTTDGVSEERFLRYAQMDYVKPCKVFQSPHYLEAVKSQRNGRKKIGAPVKKTILYIPTKLSLHYRSFNCMVYPAVWFFEFQKQLLRYFFSKRGRFNFIYKHAETKNRFMDESILPYLQESRFDNIRIDSRPTYQCFGEADAILMDRPTTAFYEALMSGLPVLGLYPDMIEGMISQEAVREFGKSIRRFATPEEAFAQIDQFLEGDPAEYQPHLPMRDDHLVQILIGER